MFHPVLRQMWFFHHSSNGRHFLVRSPCPSENNPTTFVNIVCRSFTRLYNSNSITSHFYDVIHKCPPPLNHGDLEDLSTITTLGPSCKYLTQRIKLYTKIRPSIDINATTCHYQPTTIATKTSKPKQIQYGSNS